MVEQAVRDKLTQKIIEMDLMNLVIFFLSGFRMGKLMIVDFESINCRQNWLFGISRLSLFFNSTYFWAKAYRVTEQ